MSLPGTTPTAMVDVKKEDAVVGEVVANGIELSSSGKEAWEVLKRTMSRVPGARCFDSGAAGSCRAIG